MASFTITSALFELENLDNRIKKIVDKTTFITMLKVNKTITEYNNNNSNQITRIKLLKEIN